MDLFLYNTLSGKKERFEPRDKGKVRMYACGVTVYDRCHIGHARSLFVFSLLKSLFEWLGYEVIFVRNITDIDDKIIRRIWQKSGHRQISYQELKLFTDEFVYYYYEDLIGLGLPRADFEPRATDYVDKMIEFIERLIALGYAYFTDKGNVYYSVRAFSEYGRLSHRKPGELLKGVRKEIEDDKRDALDFALWKAAKENEPFWDSPWGRGRPGWHLECAVMSTHLLGQGFDIHGGGRDLIFPHHENEIAEAEPLINGPFARYWLHHGMVTVNGEKMSKSLGNFITISDGLKRYPAQWWKMWFLSTHYRSPIDFSEEKMQEMAKMYSRLVLWFSLLAENSSSCELDNWAVRLRNGVFSALCDDLNTPKALGDLFYVVSETLDRLKEGQGSKELFQAAEEVLSLFGVLPDVSGEKGNGWIEDDVVDLLIETRQALRRHKDYALADTIRGILREKGIAIEDTPEGTRWMRI